MDQEISASMARVSEAGTNPYQAQTYRYYVLGIFTLSYMFNFVDRQILAILLQPIKLAFGLSDTQLGLLTGLTFGLFYIVMGVPIARWSDRGTRRSILAMGLGLWSLMTALCGLSQNYLQLLSARIGVGVGEAGCTPPIHSMLSNIFPPKERNKALGIYNSGVMIGMMGGFLVGGWLQEFFGWRVALMAVGVPGLLVALLIRLTVAEPRRSKTFTEGKDGDARPPTFVETIRFLWSKKTFRYMMLAGSMVAFAGYSLFTWVPSFLVRSYGLSEGTIGTWLGLSIGIGGAIGTMATGYLADRLSARDYRWYPWLLIIIYGGLSIPLLLAMFLTDSGLVALLLFVVPVSLLAGYLAPLVAVTHSLVKERMRATSSAIILLMLNLIGMGLGPTLVGMLSDFLTPSLGNEALRYSLCVLVLSSLIICMMFLLLTARHIKHEMPRYEELV